MYETNSHSVTTKTNSSNTESTRVPVKLPGFCTNNSSNEYPGSVISSLVGTLRDRCDLVALVARRAETGTVTDQKRSPDSLPPLIVRLSHPCFCQDVYPGTSGVLEIVTVSHGVGSNRQIQLWKIMIMMIRADCVAPLASGSVMVPPYW